MKRLLCLCLALLLAGLCACAQPEPLPTAADTELFAMDTVILLRIYGDDDGTVAAALQEKINALDATLSVTAERSALYALNRDGRSEDPTLLAVLREAAALSERTGGAVDPSVYPAVRLWGFTGESYHVPTQSEIDELLPSIGMEHVELTADRVRLRDGAQLDLGAFAKGWAVDRCRELLEARGLSAVLTLGGNVMTVGSKPDGSAWNIGVADPDQPDSVRLSLLLTGSRAVVTSGDYQRYFEYEGERYCHILDPATGRPVSNGLRSVTVVCDSGMTADALATALFVMGRADAEAFWRDADDFEMVLMDESGTVWVTEGLQDAVQDADVTVIAR